MSKEFFDFKYWRKVLTGSPTRKRLTGNFFSLSVLQALNYILPLITLPYLVRVLGPEKYGLISFAQAFIAYFSILTDYGFGLSATREISINRENKEKVSEIFSSVMIIKIFLGILSFVILGLILLSVPKFGNEWLLYIFTFGTVLGNILFPVWFFQGVENMKWITILNVIARGIFTVLIFVFVHKESDYLNVAIINSLGSIIAGIISLIVVFKNFKVKFIFPKLESIKYQLKEGWHIFVSNITGNLYGQGTIVILGLVSNNEIVGYYSAAEKLMKAIASLTQPIAQALYPYLVRLKNIKENFKKIFSPSIIISFIITITTFSLSNFIVKILYGSKMIYSGYILKILSIVMFFTILNVIKQPYIYALKQDKLNSFMYIFVGLSFLPVCFILSKLYLAVGTAFSLMYVEILIFSIGLYIIKKGFKNTMSK